MSDKPEYARLVPDKCTPPVGYRPYKRSRINTLIHTFRGDRLLVDMVRSRINPDKMQITERYVHMNESQVYQAGYKQAFDLKTNWEYMGQKVYVRFTNFEKYDIEHDKEPNFETAATLYDYAQSNATSKFMKSFTRVAAFDGMDTKKLASVAIIAIGFVVGFMILF